MSQLSAPAGATNTEPGQESHLRWKRDSMSKITELASSTINGTDSIVIELSDADETLAGVIVRWPLKATVCHPRRFPDTAATIARLFAEAATRLASIKANKHR
jgi:hypothetical protein